VGDELDAKRPVFLGRVGRSEDLPFEPPSPTLNVGPCQNRHSEVHPWIHCGPGLVLHEPDKLLSTKYMQVVFAAHIVNMRRDRGVIPNHRYGGDYMSEQFCPESGVADRRAPR
jgi:hypothetical protein